MSYVIQGTLIDGKREAMQALIESYLWADGMNTPEEIAEIIATPDGMGDRDTAMNLAVEMVVDFGAGELRTTGEPEFVSSRDWAGVIRGIVGVKYADPEEDARILWHESEAKDVEREDPSLVIRSQWFPREAA